MPAYNEEKNIGTVIEQWYPVVERIGGDSRLVILNDGSKDATYKKIQNYQKNHDRLIGIDKPNEGHGGTILRGYRYAVEKGADYIFQTDSDGQTLPEEFWQFWEKRQKCGLLIGYRQKREDGLSRIFVTRILRLVLFLIFWNLGKRCKYAISADGWKTARQSTEAYPKRIFPFQCADDRDL